MVNHAHRFDLGAQTSLRIAVVGGLERHEPEIERRARALGHTVEFHRGRVGGRHADELEAMVQRCDVTIMVTQVNSHGAMYIAKKAAARFERRALIARTCGPSSFSALVESLAPESHAPRDESAPASARPRGADELRSLKRSGAACTP